jgi:signal transduction histidine kinase
MAARDGEGPTATRPGRRNQLAAFIGRRANPSGRSGRKNVAAHARARAWLSVRVRIMLPVLLAALSVAALGTIQIGDAMTVANQADRSLVLARASGAIGSLAHHIAFEYVLSNDAQRRGAIAGQLTAQRALTDVALVAFARANETIRAAAPDLTNISLTVDRGLAGLAAGRAVALQRTDGSTEVFAYYNGFLNALLSLADAIAPQLSNTRLIELSRSVALVAQLDRLASLQLDLIARALLSKQLQPGDPVQLAQWFGAEREQIASLTNLRPAGALYADLRYETAVTLASTIRGIILDGRGTPASLSADATTWFNAQSKRVEGLQRMEQQLAALLETETAAVGSAARRQTYLIGLLSVGVVGTALVGGTIMAVRISRRLRRTRYAALTAARIELPTAISNVIAARDAGMVRNALAESSQRIDGLLQAGPDEIGELSSAFGAVHRQALRLAADQALLRMEVQAMFVALSRRGQTLVQRQIHLIDEFGRNEADPDALSRLFALDHLAARMRRNEENLLVLAGGEPGRWITRPVALIDLLRAAAQEIEEYRRVEVIESAPVAVAANAAGDAIHLLAELMENATSFSPPSTMVRVTARRVGAGVEVTVTDSGIGMPAKHLAEANERLSRPLALTSSLVGTMGLLVVSRLAQRHNIQVRLDAIPAAGTTATVTLPERLVMPLQSVDRLEPDRWQRDAEFAPELPAAAVTVLPRTHAPAPPLPVSASDTLALPRVPATDPAPSPVPASPRPMVDVPLPVRVSQVPDPDSPSPTPDAPLPVRVSQVPDPDSPAPIPDAPLPVRVSKRPGASPRPGVSQLPGVTQLPGIDTSPSDESQVPDTEDHIGLEVTAAGLPRRPAEEPAPRIQQTLPASIPDPESVRARLSSLANGIAAANQGAPPPPVPRSH